MARILVTGANGQLGSEIQQLSKNYPDLQFAFHDIDSLDLTDYKKVKELIIGMKPDYIINGAAYTAVDKAEDEKVLAFLLNAEVPGILAKYADDTNAKLIHISTDYVFDGNSNTPYTEADIPNPVSVYAKSKYEGEKAVLKFSNSMVIRTSWLYSAFGKNFVKNIMHLGREKKELNVIHDQFGSPTYAGDLAKTILEIIIISEKNNKFNPGIYHYSNEDSCSWYEFTVEIFKLANIKCKVNAIETRDYPLPATRPHYSVMDKTKIKKTYNIDIPLWKESLYILVPKLN